MPSTEAAGEVCVTHEDMAFVAASVAVVVLAVAAVLWSRRRRRDLEYVGLTPGLPPVGGHATVRRVRGGQEYSGQLPVQFHPPAGVSPALAGVVLDGSADPHDLGSLLVDLAVRQWLHVERLPSPGRAKDDWELVRRTPLAGDRLSPVERQLLNAIFGTGERQQLSQLREDLRLTLREAQISLYREAVDRGWYRRHPRSRNARLGCLGMALSLGSAGLAAGLLAWSRQHASELWWLLPVAVLVAGVVLAVWGRGRTPRTAAGTAARIQVLGFRKYLETAEARQIRVEEAAGLFARYLPYAMVFGLSAHWAQVFAQVMREHRTWGADVAQLGIDAATYEMFGALGDLAGSVDVTALFDGVALGTFDTGIADGLAGSVDGLVSGVGDFASSAGDLFAGGFGDGCDGCDIGCFDF